MNAFIFKSAHYDQDAKQAILSYAYKDGPIFNEIIDFVGAKETLNDLELEALNKALRALHLAVGISYYKAYCPHQIIIENEALSKAEADFFNKFYVMGLGEFSAVNNIILKGHISFPVQTTENPSPSTIKSPNACVVPIGGGKDSIVSLEALKQAGRPLRMIAVNPGRPIKDVMGVADVKGSILITRKIDKALFELNEKGAMNGHVPITGILSFIMACGAILYGYDSVVMSNEGSASEGNMEFGGIDVNHQYSKSLEFELDFEGFIKNHVLANFSYFSFLRPLSETGIACLFSSQDKYFEHFKSCNRNFHIDEGVRQYGWCCDCPKCRFVFLALAPFIDKDKLVTIFGKNMLNDPAQEQGFRELTGLLGHKPFECVGEIEECQYIIKCLSTMPQWKDDHIVGALATELEIPALSQAALKNQALKLKYQHNIPEDYREDLNAFIRSCQ